MNSYTEEIKPGTIVVDIKFTMGTESNLIFPKGYMIARKERRQQWKRFGPSSERKPNSRNYRWIIVLLFST